MFYLQLRGKYYDQLCWIFTFFDDIKILEKCYVHVQPRCTRTTALHTYNYAARVQPRCTRTTTLHTYNHAAHVQPRCTRTTTLHTYNCAAHVQPRCTRTTALHTYNCAARVQLRCTRTTTLHTYNYAAHVQPRCTPFFNFFFLENIKILEKFYVQNRRWLFFTKKYKSSGEVLRLVLLMTFFRSS